PMDCRIIVFSTIIFVCQLLDSVAQELSYPFSFNICKDRINVRLLQACSNQSENYFNSQCECQSCTIVKQRCFSNPNDLICPKYRELNYCALNTTSSGNASSFTPTTSARGVESTSGATDNLLLTTDSNGKVYDGLSTAVKITIPILIIIVVVIGIAVFIRLKYADVIRVKFTSFCRLLPRSRQAHTQPPLAAFENNSAIQQNNTNGRVSVLSEPTVIESVSPLLDEQQQQQQHVENGSDYEPVVVDIPDTPDPAPQANA
ncbi:hypothetical protein BOX15_Mlig032714g5, partial [Macrostomum lignano]